MRKHIAIDFETWYDDTYSLKTMPTWDYVFGPQFNAYMVSVHDGTNTWVGNPKDYDWQQLDGFQIDMHNASFDGLVLQRLQKDGIVPPLKVRLFDTADMVAYMRIQRNLKSAAKHLLDVTVSKLTRSKMKGMTLAQAEAAGMGEELKKYAASDAVLCWQLAEKYGDRWPEVEKEASRLNRESCWRGFQVDTNLLGKSIITLGDARLAAARVIPWYTTDEDTPLSAEKMKKQAQKDGIPFPASLDKRNAEAVLWEETYAEKFPWVRAIRDYRRTNMFYQRCRLLRDGVREDGTFPYAAMYFGAATGRIQSGSGEDERDSDKRFNMFNMPREALFGVDIRNHIIPRPGKVFLASDFSAIEGIVLLWRVGGYQELLKRFEAGEDLYEIYARDMGRWTDSGSLKKLRPLLRQHCKVDVLAGGYQIGPARYQNTAKTQYGVDFTDDEARKNVYEFRNKNPRIVAFWKQHNDSAMNSCVLRHDKHEVELASGRVLTYWKPHMSEGTWPSGDKRMEMTANHILGGPKKHLYGGKLTENEIQATARDILRDATVALDKEGIPVVFSVYDEIVSEVDKTDAPELLKKQELIMTNSSPWLTHPILGKCPLRVESHIMNFYRKA